MWVYHIWQKFLKPVRSWVWHRKSAPFWYKGTKGLEFELVPGEFIDYYIYTEGAYEKRLLYLIEAFVSNKRTALDVGANIGNHALFMSTTFETVHAFEPNPHVAKRLKRHIARNRIESIEIHEFGLGAEDAELPFALGVSGNAGTGNFVKTENCSTIDLAVRKGDHVVEEQRISDIDFIKLDVEGFELPALRGLSKTIRRDRPLISFEFYPKDFHEHYFEGFQQVLPGYVFYECVSHLPAGWIGRLAAYVRNAGLPWLKRIENIDQRPYPMIFAIPSERRYELDLPGVR